MSIRYFFIAGAITSGLTLAIQTSDHIVAKQIYPIVAPYTEYTNGFEFFERKSNIEDTEITLIHKVSSNSQQRDREDLYEKSKNLFNSIIEFTVSFFMYCINWLFSRG
ncbi:hypothetical protein [Bartonella doshiae]|uniref:hypothetical protein n=1 Tax=Bartonella doshiae TaxID=33044 RepID=UPI000944AA0E|nr:hypothetical protein [Bartonella doshiae]